MHGDDVGALLEHPGLGVGELGGDAAERVVEGLDGLAAQILGDGGDGLDGAGRGLDDPR
nr:hypothetical protein [Microcella flavibacter]